MLLLCRILQFVMPWAAAGVAIINVPGCLPGYGVWWYLQFACKILRVNIL